MPRETVYPAMAAPRTGGLVASSFEYYLTGTESLRIEAFTRTAVDVVQVTWRFWDEVERRIQTNAGDFPVTTILTTITKTLPLAAGALIGLRIGVETPLLNLDALWIRASLVKGFAGGTRVVATLVQGYVSSQADLAWPGSPLQNQHDGRGLIDTRTWTQFAAPLRLEITVPVGERWRPIGGRFGFTASAVAGTRNPLLAWTNIFANFSYVSANGIGVAAGNRETYSFGAGQSPSAVAAAFTSQLSFPADVDLGGGEKLSVLLDAPQAGDAFDSAYVSVRKWFDF